MAVVLSVVKLAAWFQALIATLRQLLLLALCCRYMCDCISITVGSATQLAADCMCTD